MDAPARSLTTRADMAKNREWTGHWSPADWNPSQRMRRAGPAEVETTFAGCEPGSGLELRVECLAYDDYPIVEWTAWFTNTGTRPAPIHRAAGQRVARQFDVPERDTGFIQDIRLRPGKPRKRREDGAGGKSTARGRHHVGAAEAGRSDLVLSPVLTAPGGMRSASQGP